MVRPICKCGNPVEFDTCLRSCLQRTFGCLRMTWDGRDDVYGLGSCIRIPEAFTLNLFPGSCDYYGYNNECDDPDDGRVYVKAGFSIDGSGDPIVFAQIYLVRAHAEIVERILFTAPIPGGEQPEDCVGLFPITLTAVGCASGETGEGTNVVDPTDATSVVPDFTSANCVGLNSTPDPMASTVTLTALTSRCRHVAPWVMLPSAVHGLNRCDDQDPLIGPTSHVGQKNLCRAQGRMRPQANFQAHYPAIWKATVSNIGDTGNGAAMNGRTFYFYDTGNGTTFAVMEQDDRDIWTVGGSEIAVTFQPYAGTNNNHRIAVTGSDGVANYESAAIDAQSMMPFDSMTPLSYVSGGFTELGMATADFEVAPIRTGRPNIYHVTGSVKTACWGWGTDPPRVVVRYNPGNGNGPYLVSLDYQGGEPADWTGDFVGADDETDILFTMAPGNGSTDRFISARVNKSTFPGIAATWLQEYPNPEHKAACDTGTYDPGLFGAPGPTYLKYFDCSSLVGTFIDLEDADAGFENASLEIVEMLWDLCA